MNKYSYDPLGFMPLYSRADANGVWAAQLAANMAMQKLDCVKVTGSVAVQIKEDDDSMETLYEVFVVSKARKIVVHEFAVAKDEAGAQFRAGVDAALRTAGLEPDDVTILCRAVGQVEVEKKPQRMKIVTDEPTV